MKSIKNRPDQHGFVLIGRNTFYLDHLPMFYMEDHMYHAILEIDLPANATEQYLKDQASHPESLYILGNLKNDLFTLPSVAIGETTTFQADIFRGLPEDPNTDVPLIHNVKINIRRPIRLRHFDYNMEYPRNLTYVLYGNEQEAFLSHYLTKKPDFMNVVQLKNVPDWLPMEQLKMGANINICDLSSTPIPCKYPLTDHQYNVSYEGQDFIFDIKPARNVFFSTSVPNETNPCPSQPSIPEQNYSDYAKN